MVDRSPGGMPRYRTEGLDPEQIAVAGADQMETVARNVSNFRQRTFTFISSDASAVHIKPEHPNEVARIVEQNYQRLAMIAAKVATAITAPQMTNIRSTGSPLSRADLVVFPTRFDSDPRSRWGKPRPEIPPMRSYGPFRIDLNRRSGQNYGRSDRIVPTGTIIYS